ncbi:MAG TPA: cupin domain-containing protein [Thermodesulfobacteriota bacterium]
MRKIDKPWGHELVWAETPRYVGKVLAIKAGERLSLQYHRVKDESILVAKGLMDLEVEEDGRMVTRRMRPGDTYHVVPGQKHRMIAVEDTEVIEVSTPELDDVVRLEDRYGRVGR